MEGDFGLNDLSERVIKTINNFKKALFNEEAYIFHVLYTVTFGMTSATKLLKHIVHGLTKHVHKQNENVITLIRAICKNHMIGDEV